MFLDQIGFRELSQSLEATIGGRVAPMIYMPKPGVGERSEVEAFDFSTAGGFTEANKKKMEQEEKEMLSANLLALTDPFLMNVHHRHSFLKLDPFRWLQALIFPEGFPAHPHAGFNTLTYVLKGQMKHRDSMGVKQVYGNGAAQFLTAGNGVLHEEMWEFSKGRDMELFQIWINLPRRHKDIDPSLQLVGDTDNHDGKGPIPEITILSPSSSSSTSSSSVFSASPRGAEKKVTVRVLMGEAHGLQGKLESLTPMTVLHVSMDSGSSWAFPLPSHHTCHIYARKGPLDVLVDAGGGRDGGKPGLVRVETHETAFMKTGGELLQVHSPLDGKGGSDFLVLAGEPLREPVAASGPWVFNEASEATRAYARYQTGAFGLPWEHTLDDEAWRDVCRVGRRGGGGEGGGGGGGITRDL
ncbi:pirin-like protein [Nannochloropsis oceanica]